MKTRTMRLMRTVVVSCSLVIVIHFQSFQQDVADSSCVWAGELQLGQSPPAEIGATLSSGDWVGRKDYRGKYLLVVYWSMQDPGYEKWDEALRELRQDSLDRRDFMILSICVDKDFEKWMKYLSDAKPLERAGERLALWQDKTWWHANVADYKPNPDLLDPEHRTVAHLLGPDGKFLATRIPLSDLKKTVQSKTARP